MIDRRGLFRSAAGAGVALAGVRIIPSAHADQAYPSYPVRWVVPYTAGGATDVLSRLICQRLSERLGQPFVVENKPGAGSNIGTQAVIAAPPDGHTLLLTSTANAINASFDPSLPFDFAKSIAPVAGVARIPLVLVVNNDLPAGSLAEFIAYAKPIQENSRSLLRASALRCTCPASCSRRWPASNSRMCPIAARRRA